MAGILLDCSPKYGETAPSVAWSFCCLPGVAYPAMPPTITSDSSRQRLGRLRRSSLARSIPAADHTSFRWDRLPSAGAVLNSTFSSAFSILDPPSCPHTPDPYQVSADLGALPDGEYTVVSTVGPLVVRDTFIVLNGQLQAVAIPVPALDLRALVTLLALVAGIGILARWWEARGRTARAQTSAGTYCTSSRRHECW